MKTPISSGPAEAVHLAFQMQKQVIPAGLGSIEIPAEQEKESNERVKIGFSSCDQHRSTYRVCNPV